MMRWLRTLARTRDIFELRQRRGGVAADRGPGDAAVDDEGRMEALFQHPRFADQLDRVRGGPHVVGRWLDGNEHGVAGEDRRASELDAPSMIATS